jgi:hypothetical protein
MDPLLASAEESPVGGGGAAASVAAASSPTLGLPAPSAAAAAGSWSAVGGSASSDREAAAVGASAAAGAGMPQGIAPTPQQLAHKVVQGLWASPTPAEMQLERAATNMAVLDDAVRLFSILDSLSHFYIFTRYFCAQS